MKKFVIGVIFGGKTTEHEVSLRSAQNVVAHLDPERYDVIPLALTKKNLLVVAGSQQTAEAIRLGGQHVLEQQCILDQDEHDALPLAAIASLGLDVVIPVMHGNFGEDGRLQGFLEMLEIPYVGSNVLGSSIGMDKHIQKVLVAATGIAVLPFTVFSAANWEKNPELIRQQVTEICGFPCFIKPANNGSSVGIGKANTAEELDILIVAASLYDTKIIVEKAATAPRELEVSVIGHRTIRAAQTIAEIAPNTGFYDYDAKYDPTSTAQVHIPAALEPEEEELLRRHAETVYRITQASGLSRVDFFLEPDGTIYFNEINTLPGFTSISAFAQMWAADGMSYAELLDSLIATALERKEEQSLLRYEA